MRRQLADWRDRRLDQLSSGLPLPSKGRAVVYVILSHAGLIKVGHTSDLEKRLWSLHTVSPTYQELISWFDPRLFGHGDALRTELLIHGVLAESRAHGEWFRFTREVSDFCAATLNLGALSALLERWWQVPLKKGRR